MADDSEGAQPAADDDSLKSYRDHLEKIRGHVQDLGKHLADAGKHLDNANDMMDAFERHINEAKGNPLPQRRPIAAGPDAAGNDRSSNRRNVLYDKR
jgi:hypothetical protein